MVKVVFIIPGLSVSSGRKRISAISSPSLARVWMSRTTDTRLVATPAESSPYRLVGNLPEEESDQGNDAVGSQEKEGVPAKRVSEAWNRPRTMPVGFMSLGPASCSDCSC